MAARMRIQGAVHDLLGKPHRIFGDTSWAIQLPF
jgi:hypothetical protein